MSINTIIAIAFLVITVGIIIHTLIEENRDRNQIE